MRRCIVLITCFLIWQPSLTGVLGGKVVFHAFWSENSHRHSCPRPRQMHWDSRKSSSILLIYWHGEESQQHFSTAGAVCTTDQHSISPLIDQHTILSSLHSTGHSHM